MGKLKRVLRYLLGTKHMGITLEADSQIIRLRCFVDASYGVHRDCKSHTGTVISLGSGPVLVKSVKQKIKALLKLNSWAYLTLCLLLYGAETSWKHKDMICLLLKFFRTICLL